MNIIDMKTLVVNQTLTYAICSLVMWLLWRQNRRRFPGLEFWLVGFILQTISIVFIALRGVIPDWLSIVFGGNGLPLAGTILLYIGLERFIGLSSRQAYNIALLVISMMIHAYFGLVQVDLGMRNINLSFFGLFMYFQITWLALRRAPAVWRPLMSRIGWIFIAFSALSVARIIVNLTEPAGNDLLAANNTFDVFLILGYQALFFATIFSLFLMVNQRLFWDLRDQKTAMQKSEARYRQLVEFLPIAIFVYHDGRLDLLNSSALNLMRANHPHDLLGKSVFDFVHPDYHAVARKRIESVLETGQAAPLMEVKFIRLDGALIDVEVTTAPFEHQGAPALQTLARDITERKRADAVLRLRLKLMDFAAEHPLEELMRYALDEVCELTNSPIGFYHFVEADQQKISLQAWSTRTLQEFCEIQEPGARYDVDKAGVWADCIRARGPVIHNDYPSLPGRKGLPTGHADLNRELVVPTMSDGKIVSVLGVGNKPFDYIEDDVALVSYVADVIWEVIERKRIETQLREYQEQLESQNLELQKLWLAVEQSGNTVVITDSNGIIQYANSAFEQSSGYTVREAVGRNPRMLKSGLQSGEFYRDFWQVISSGQVWRGEFHNRRKDGSFYWEAAVIAPVQGDNGQIVNYIAIKEDISERKKLEMELERLATQDSLTGVLNRRQLIVLALQEMERSHRYGYSYSIIMLDIDHFKNINDTYGHPVGDLALSSLGQLFFRELRVSDLVGRYGGEEFLLFLPETRLEQARNIAERIRLAVMDMAIIVDETPIRLTVSMGVSSVDAGRGDFDSLVKEADALLYQAKQRGRNRVVTCLDEA